MVKLLVNYPGEDEYLSILSRTTGTAKSAIEPVASGGEIIAMRAIVRAVSRRRHVRSANRCSVTPCDW